MRVRDHLLLSSAGAALLYPRLRSAALVPWAASMLIDADHYAWFCLSERNYNPIAAIRYFGQAHPSQHLGTRLLHTVGLAALAPMRGRLARLLLLGMAFHVALDAFHLVMTRRSRRITLARDGYTCQGCGARGPQVEVHQWRYAWLLPSYDASHYISLCYRCHDLAHAGRTQRPENVDGTPDQAA